MFVFLNPVEMISNSSHTASNLRLQEVDQHLSDEATKKKIEYSIKKAIAESINSTDFRRELVEIIQKEQDKLKDIVIAQIRDQKEAVVEHVRKQQEVQIQEKIKIKQQLEIIIYENNRKIAEQQEKLFGLTKDAEQERLKELERIQREKEEQKRRADEARLIELQQKAEEEKAKSVILNKNKNRQPVTFSFFG